MGKYTERVQLVLDRLKIIAGDEESAESMSGLMDMMLSDLQGEGLFGTEGQSDPRGDFRIQQWNMSYVQGVDEK